MTAQNQALADELEAVNSIYGENTCSITKFDPLTSETTAILILPDLPLSFLLSLSQQYPDTPPNIIGTQSTGASTKIGQGEAAASILRDVLGRIFVPGQVCLFDLIEETTPLLKGELQYRVPQPSTTPAQHTHDGSFEDQFKCASQRSAIPDNTSLSELPTQFQPLHTQDLTHSTHAAFAKASDATDNPRMTEPNWILSEPLVVNKSTFVARALAIDSLNEATNSISHLLATNKRVAGATHNITAWRIKQKQAEKVSASLSTTQTNKHQQASNSSAPEIVIQDCDDDGETAAGGRLLHLMQLMEVWNVVVVVTRWYGGVKLGSDRFRCINNVAREALVKGGFGKEDQDDKGRSEKGKSKKK